MARESPRTHRAPISPGGTARPSSSRTLTSKPGTTCPRVPGRTAPGRLEMKMCHISAVPRPSRSSTPKIAFHRSCSSTGSASPADVQSRSRDTFCRRASPWLTMWLIIVGTLIRIVGRNRASFAKITSAVHGSGNSTAAPPTAKGKNRLEPVAYPKNSFGTDSVTSRSVYPITPLA